MSKPKKKLNIDIGSRIAATRKRRSLTQEELATALELTPQYLSDLERGVVGASLETVLRICDTLDISTEYLLRGIEDTDVKRKIVWLRDMSPEQLDAISEAINAS